MSDNEGRKRLRDRDRQADAGEQRAEYRSWEWQEAEDPLGEARADAVEDNADHNEYQPPGMSRDNERRQRERRVEDQR
jgi:hypothetical protein